MLELTATMVYRPSDDSENLYGTSNNFMYDDPGDALGPKSCDLWKPVVTAVNGMCCGGALFVS